MPADVNIWILACAGFGAGLVGSMLGVGGGLITVPVLTLALGIPIKFAIGSSLVTIVVNSCTAAGYYMSRRMTNIKLGLLLATALVPGAAAGAFIANSLPNYILTLIFGGFLFYAAYAMLPVRKQQVIPLAAEPEKNAACKTPASYAWLDDSYYDPAVNQDIAYTVNRPLIGMVASFFGGVLSSMLGIGGGIISVPVMNHVMSVPIKATIATSSLMLSFTAITGALVYSFNGYVLPYVIAPLCIGTFLGARLGAFMAHKMMGKILLFSFAVLAALTAIMMFMRALNIIEG